MALNRQTFITRTLTAIVFAAVMLTGLLWNHWSFIVLFSVIHFGCWWEYLRLMEKIYNTSFHNYSKIGWMLLGYGIFLLFADVPFQIAGCVLKDNFSLPVSAAGFVMLIMGIFQNNKITLKAFGAAALGLLYISLSLSFMMVLWELDSFLIFNDSPKFVIIEFWGGFGVLPIIVIACMWVNDTMAYIVGSFIGKTPFSKISPKKTWEGTIGGILLCVVVVGWLSNLYISHNHEKVGMFDLQLNHSHLYIIAAIAAIAGTAGDLLESKLKRLAGVKDSGSIMPGHGGFLDRFDSLLLATPAVWLYIKLLL